MSDRKRVDRYAKVMLAAWEKAEGKPVNVSYVATFADMARAVIEEIDQTDVSDARSESYEDGFRDGYNDAIGGSSWW